MGEGRIDGLWGIVGMLCCGALFAAVYPVMKAQIISLGSLGKISLPQAVGVSHWIVIIALAAVSIVLFVFFERKRL